jgi:hydrophobic/amphiphilic exporter-1 (mainly G- bacteria), HAE1 family
MFEFLPRLAVVRPVLTTMLVAVFIVLGAYGYSRLRIDLFPDVEFPVVSVSTVYPGAGPEEVETQLTDPLEEAISTLAGIDELRSFSRENVSIIIVQFDLGVDQDQAAIDVRDRVDSIRGQLPLNIEPPVVQKFDLAALPIMNIALAGPQGVDVLFELADEEIRERLSRVDGVAGVEVVGGRTREVEVLVDQQRLVAHGITLSDIVSLIGAENVSVPAGRITEERADIPVRVVGEYRSTGDIGDLRLMMQGGRVVRLADVATVRDGFEDRRSLARYNGEPAVSISVQKRADANTVTTAAGVLRELEAIGERLPPGATITAVRDQSIFISDAVADVLRNLLIGILLTTGVLFLFLHSWRGTIIAAAAMPATIVSAFLLMDAAGFTLNVMTLMALGITVGILVTNTIVVLENIYRRLDAGDAPGDAAARGTSQIAVAVAASTLTNLVVFTPIAFMEGIIGQFFYAFGLTVVFATLFSIFISFTLAPLLAARLLRTHETRREEEEGALAPLWKRWDATYRSLEDGYRQGLGWALARPLNGWIVVATVTVVALSVLFLATRFVGGEFLPRGDERGVRITLELPPGTPLEMTSDVAASAEAMLLQVPEVESVLATVGRAGGGFVGTGAGVNNAEIIVTLRDEGRPTDDVVRSIRPMLADLPDAEASAVAADPGGGPGGGQAPIQVLISGPEYGVLQRLAEEVTNVLAREPVLSEVDNTQEAPRTELTFRPDRAALADYGLTVGQVGEAVRASIEGAVAGVFRGEVGRERDIRVRLVEDARQRAGQIAELQIRTQNGTVPLAALGEITMAGAPTAVQRVERVRTVQVNAQIGVGTLTEAVSAVQARMAEVPLPPGYNWRIAGEFEQFGDAIGSVLIALALAIILTYIVLAMILESFVHPFTIMVTLPLGAVGAVLGLFLWGASMNIFSMMAIIMLAGIVVNNAILILDLTAQLRAEGRTVVEALLEAAPARLMPIVMTNVAIVFALIPQALGTGAGAAFRVPMAVVTMGGVVMSAVFTLMLIPVIYAKFDRIAAFVLRRRPAVED